MKAQIKVLVKKDICSPQIIDNGDWIDLKAAKNIKYLQPQAKREHQVNNMKQRDVEVYNTLVPLGVCIKIPDGYEAILAPRSSSFKNYGFIQTNSIGVIDSSYCGNDDEWKLPVAALHRVEINEGQRVAQFRIQLSQKATIWQKIKWFFTNGVEIKYVNSLENNNRGGFGSTGV